MTHNSPRCTQKLNSVCILGTKL